MKKYIGIIFISIIMVITPVTVLAHPGRTDLNSCHKCNGDNTDCAQWGLTDGEYHCHNKNDNTYTNSKGEVYDKSGTKISGGNTSNNNSTEKEENVDNNTTNQEKPSNDNTGNSNNPTSNTKPENSTTKPSTSKPVEKSKDTSLKIVKADDNEILIVEDMVYETSKKNIELNIEATDSKAKVEFQNQELLIGENEILIKVTAEAGNSKEYKLIITRKEIQSSVIIKKFVFGSNEIKFENNKATIEKLTTESTFKYSYELSDEKAKLLLYVNDKEVTEFNNIKNEDVIKLVVIDSDDNKNVYEINVTEASEAESFIINAIAYTIVAGIFLSPAIIVGVIIYIKKRKK